MRERGRDGAGVIEGKGVGYVRWGGVGGGGFFF